MSEIIKVDLKNKTILTDDGKSYPLRVNNDIEEIFKIQKEFQKNFYVVEQLDQKEKVNLSKEYILSSMRELSEILDQLPWKSHRKYTELNVNKEELSEEIIDAIKFILNLCVIWDINSDNFIDAFKKKSLKVQQRHDQEFKN